MEVSPLKQEVRPDTFEPKVVQLYRQLLRVDTYCPIVFPSFD